METKKAIEMAGSATALAALLGISVAAVSQWGDSLPQQRVWQLRVMCPQWFSDELQNQVHTDSEQRVA